MKNITERKVFVPSKPWGPRNPEDVACWAVVDEMNSRLEWVKTISADICCFLSGGNNCLLVEVATKGLRYQKLLYEAPDKELWLLPGVELRLYEETLFYRPNNEPKSTNEGYVIYEIGDKDYDHRVDYLQDLIYTNLFFYLIECGLFANKDDYPVDIPDRTRDFKYKAGGQQLMSVLCQRQVGTTNLMYLSDLWYALAETDVFRSAATTLRQDYNNITTNREFREKCAGAYLSLKQQLPKILIKCQ